MSLKDSCSSPHMFDLSAHTQAAMRAAQPPPLAQRSLVAPAPSPNAPCAGSPGPPLCWTEHASSNEGLRTALELLPHPHMCRRSCHAAAATQLPSRSVASGTACCAERTTLPTYASRSKGVASSRATRASFTQVLFGRSCHAAAELVCRGAAHAARSVPRCRRTRAAQRGWPAPGPPGRPSWRSTPSRAACPGAAPCSTALLQAHIRIYELIKYILERGWRAGSIQLAGEARILHTQTGPEPHIIHQASGLVVQGLPLAAGLHCPCTGQAYWVHPAGCTGQDIAHTNSPYTTHHRPSVRALCPAVAPHSRAALEVCGADNLSRLSLGESA